jgi:hypothetical protein
MNKKTLTILKDIADEQRIKPFIKRELLNYMLSKYLGGEYNREIRLIIRISNAGYIASLTKKTNVNEKEVDEKEKERVIQCLYDDESIDKNTASEVLALLSEAIKYAWDKEAACAEELKKQAEIKETQERTNEDIRMKDVLGVSLSRLIKSYGINILDNFNFCRAILKDMSQGNYVDEITLISFLFEKRIQNKILKPKLFKVKTKNLVIKLVSIYADTHNFGVDPKMVIELIVDVINKSAELNKHEGNKSGWMRNFIRFSKKQ